MRRNGGEGLSWGVRTGYGRVIGVVVAMCSACDVGILEDEFAVVELWLNCVECIEGEREAVAALGPRAAPVLLDFMVLPESYDSALVSRYRRQHQALSAPVTAQVAYVDQALANYKAATQKRAAVSLGDVGAEDRLRTALDSVGPWGLRSDVVGVIRHALERATGVQPSIVGIAVAPTPIGVGVGSTVTPLITFRDVHGNVLGLAADAGAVATSDPAVATVTPAGLVTGVVAGSTTLNVSAGGVSRSVQINVVEQAPILEIVSGNFQDTLAATGLTLPVTVQASSGGGVALGGVDVTWEVLEGGGTVPSHSLTSAPGGQAGVFWSLGPTPGLNRLRATAFGGNSVVFFAVATGEIPGTLPDPSSEIRVYVIRSGGAVRDAPVELRAGGSGGALLRTERTNPFGFVSFSGLSAGQYAVVVPLTGFGPGSVVGLDGTNVRVVTIEP